MEGSRITLLSYLMEGSRITLLSCLMVLLCSPAAPQGYAPQNYPPPPNYQLLRNPPPPTHFYPPPPPNNYFPSPQNPGGALPFPNMVSGPLPPLPPIGPPPDINNPMPAEAVNAGSGHGFGTPHFEAEMEAGVDPHAGGGGAAVSHSTSLLSSSGGQATSLLDAYYGNRPGSASGSDAGFGSAAGNLFGAYMMKEYIF